MATSCINANKKPNFSVLHTLINVVLFFEFETPKIKKQRVVPEINAIVWTSSYYVQLNRQIVAMHNYVGK